MTELSLEKDRDGPLSLEWCDTVHGREGIKLWKG